MNTLLDIIRDDIVAAIVVPSMCVGLLYWMAKTIESVEEHERKKNQI